MSILDLSDDTVLNAASTRAAVNIELHNREGELYKYLMGSEQANVCIHDDGMLEVSNYLFFSGKQNRNMKDMSGFLQDDVITKLSVKEIDISDIDTIEPNLLSGNIYAADIDVMNCKEIKDMTFHVQDFPTARHTQFTIFNAGDMKFKDTRVQYDNGAKDNTLVFSKTTKFPNLDGLTSDATSITFLCYNEQEKVCAETLMKLCKTDYKCLIHDNTKKEDVYMPIKTIRKAMGVANNYKRYKLLSQIIEVKDNAKISDLLPIKNFPDLNTIIFRTSGCQLILAKKESSYCRPMSGMRTPNREVDVDELYTKTADGWYMIWICD